MRNQKSAAVALREPMTNVVSRGMNIVKFRENEKVRLRVDLPVHNLRRGSNGVVVGAFEDPDEAYEVEFAEKAGSVTCMLKPTQIEPTR